jgi:hypothetical protein
MTLRPVVCHSSSCQELFYFRFATLVVHPSRPALQQPIYLPLRLLWPIYDATPFAVCHSPLINNDPASYSTSMTLRCLWLVSRHTLRCAHVYFLGDIFSFPCCAPTTQPLLHHKNMLTVTNRNDHRQTQSRSYNRSSTRNNGTNQVSKILKTKEPIEHPAL